MAARACSIMHPSTLITALTATTPLTSSSAALAPASAPPASPLASALAAESVPRRLLSSDTGRPPSFCFVMLAA